MSNPEGLSQVTRGSSATGRRVCGGLRRVRLALRVATGTQVRILAANDWRLGDEIMAIPLYGAVKQRWPRSHLTVRCNYPELLRGNPWVDAVNGAGRPIDKILDFKIDDPAWLRTLSLSARYRLPVPPERPLVRLSPEAVRRVREEFDLPSGPLVGLSAGATWACKHWPFEFFEELARAIEAQTGARVVQLGKDCRATEAGVDLIGRTTVEEAASVLSLCRVFAGNDSGLTHLALAVGTHAIGLYGPVDPLTRVGKASAFTPLCTPVECRFCWSRGRMLKPGECPIGTPICMERIPMADALAAVVNALAAPSSHRECCGQPAWPSGPQ